MENQLRRDVRFLKLYAVAMTLAFAFLVLAAFQTDNRTKFREIDVERINVVEPNGKLDLAISNAKQLPPPVLNGKVMTRSGDIGSGTVPGMIFFNGNGEEQGGLAWSSHSENGKYSAGAGLLFDQYNHDQTVGLVYEDNNGKRSAGMRVWDHPDTSLTDIWDESQKIAKMKPGSERDSAQKKLAEAWGVQRVFVGKQADKSAILMLADAKGKTRLKIAVDAAGKPTIDFLDENGKSIYTLPPSP
jgi:hypothetical protein